MRAQQVVEKLLQEDQLSMAIFHVPGITGDIGVSAIEDPANGIDVFQALMSSLKDSTDKDLDRYLHVADDAIDMLISEYGAVGIVVDVEGAFHLYSRNKSNKLPLTFTQRARILLSLNPATKMLWHRNLNGEGTAEVTADVAVFGMRPADDPNGGTRRP